MLVLVDDDLLFENAPVVVVVVVNQWLRKLPTSGASSPQRTVTTAASVGTFRSRINQVGTAVCRRRLGLAGAIASSRRAPVPRG